MQRKVQVLNLFTPLINLKSIFKTKGSAIGIKICFQISGTKCVIDSGYRENIVQILSR